MFQVNFSAFHSTYEVDTPLCSAKELEMMQNRRPQSKKMSMVMISPESDCLKNMISQMNSSPSFALLPDNSDHVRYVFESIAVKTVRPVQER